MNHRLTVLAATDLSGMALLAVRRAAAIARARGARLELLHVIDSFSTAWADAHLASGPNSCTLTLPAEEGLTAIAAAVRTEFGLRANGVVVDGKPAVEIAARSEAVDADLVVLGARGMNPGLTPVLGTTAHRVLARSRRPVLLVKRAGASDQTNTPYRHIVVGSDLSPDAAAATHCARALFPDATVTLLHAYEGLCQAEREQPLIDEAGVGGPEPVDRRRELEAFAEKTRSTDAFRVVRHGSAARRICEYGRDSAADLIVVGSTRTSLRRRLAIGGVSMDTIVAADCDVLLARTPPNIFLNR
jgi:nucleotide-binding universal stress UspA family protein